MALWLSAMCIVLVADLVGASADLVHASALGQANCCLHNNGLCFS